MNHIYVRKPRGYRCEAVGARLCFFRLVHIKGRQAGLEEIVVGKSVPALEGGRGRIKATSARGLACGDTSDVAKNNEESIPRVVTTG